MVRVPLLCDDFSRPYIDKWVLGGAEAPPNFWHLYLKNIAHSHSTQLLMMCSES